MNPTQQKLSIITVSILAITGLITLLNISKPTQSTTSVFDTPNLNTTANNTQKDTTQPFSNPSNPSNPKNKQNNSPFNSNQANNATNPYLPPGFPEPLPPLDPIKLKQNDDLIAQGDAIVAEMNTLIAGLDLPKIKLSAAQQTQLNTQRQTQQTRLEDIKAQLEALKQDL